MGLWAKEDPEDSDIPLLEPGWFRLGVVPGGYLTDEGTPVFGTALFRAQASEYYLQWREADGENAFFPVSSVGVLEGAVTSYTMDTPFGG